eukprot:280672-Pyramimonas_sp.AAC.1
MENTRKPSTLNPGATWRVIFANTVNPTYALDPGTTYRVAFRETLNPTPYTRAPPGGSSWGSPGGATRAAACRPHAAPPLPACHPAAPPRCLRADSELTQS